MAKRKLSRAARQQLRQGLGFVIACGLIVALGWGAWQWWLTPTPPLPRPDLTRVTGPLTLPSTPAAPAATAGPEAAVLPSPSPAVPAPVPRVVPPLMPAEAPRYQVNAVAFTPQPGVPMVVIVLDDIGVSAKNSAAAVALPGPLTLSFLAYGEATARLAPQARQQGHEVMVHLPMEAAFAATEVPVGYGPHPLLVQQDPTQRQANFQANLRPLRAVAVGINNHMGSALTAQRDLMAQVLSWTAAERMFFLDSMTTPHSQTRYAQQDLRTTQGFAAAPPVLYRDVFLDHEITPAFINAALAKTIATAKRKGYAIAIGHPHPETVAALRAWLPTLAQQGVQLAPITAVLSQKVKP